MPEDTAQILDQLRGALEQSGYRSLVLQEVLEHDDERRDASSTLETLLDALGGVADAMRAHAASIELLQPRSGAHGKLWEPAPRRSSAAQEDDDAFVLSLDLGRARELRQLADRLSDLLLGLRDRDADEE